MTEDFLTTFCRNEAESVYIVPFLLVCGSSQSFSCKQNVIEACRIWSHKSEWNIMSQTVWHWTGVMWYSARYC